MSPRTAPLRLEPVKSIAQPGPAKKPIDLSYISCRWRADRVEIRNRADGTYECMNPMADGAFSITDLQAQRALVEPLLDPRALARIETARAARRP